MKIDEVTVHCASHSSAIAFLRSRNILRREAPPCEICEEEMSVVKTEPGEVHTWSCRHHDSEQLSERHGSFLEGEKISYEDFTMLVYLWTHEIRLSTTAEMVGLAESTVERWFASFQTVCSDHFANNLASIGGVGHLVQIDTFEYAISRKRKKNHDDDHDDDDDDDDGDDDDDDCIATQRMVFAGLDTTTNLGFVVSLPDRSTSTLLSLIETFILPGSTVHSYKRDVYKKKIGKIPVNPPFIHRMVNQLNAVKCMWGNCKTRLTAMQGLVSTRLPSYLDEFMWRQRYGRTHTEAFDNLLLHISQLYVTP